MEIRFKKQIYAEGGFNYGLGTVRPASLWHPSRGCREGVRIECLCRYLFPYLQSSSRKFM